MNERMLSRGLVLTVILLFLGLAVQPSMALTQPNIENKPDLEILDIIFKTDYGHHPIPYLSFYCRVKNIGDSTIDSMIDITIHSFKCLFLVPVLHIKTFKTLSKPGSILKPGETMEIYIGEGPHFLIGGIYWFFAQVNPKKTIDESNYNNNYYRERALTLGIFNYIVGWTDFR